MREKLKYFIINKAYDYSRGIFENMAPEGNTLCFHSKDKTGVGHFMTRIFDSGEREMTWHRLIINTKNCVPEDIRLTVFCTDKEKMTYKGAETTKTDLFADKKLTLQEKADIFSPFAAKQISGASDVLLHDVKGRYLWVLIEQYSPGPSPAGICDIRILLPSASWIDHLPQIYRNSDRDTHFLERYLGIFQTLYEELDEEIASASLHFDPESAEGEFLSWLAGWLNIREVSVWTEAQLRQLLMEAVSLYRIRGTKEGLSRIIELYTGEKPFIIEGTRIKETAASMPNGKAILEMYGSNPYSVTVLIKPGNDTEVIRRLAEEMLPLTVQLNLVELDPYIYLDNYAYLGVNSTLGKYRPAVLDGSSQLMSSVLGGEENETK